jgi:hypothetical protein
LGSEVIVILVVGVFDGGKLGEGVCSWAKVPDVVMSSIRAIPV